MNTKLTLSLEKEVIERAKSYAKKTGRSLSELVESYFKNLTKNSDSEEEIDPEIKKLIGIVQLPPDFDEKKALQEYYDEKYKL